MFQFRKKPDNDWRQASDSEHYFLTWVPNPDQKCEITIVLIIASFSPDFCGKF